MSDADLVECCEYVQGTNEKDAMFHIGREQYVKSITSNTSMLSVVLEDYKYKNINQRVGH